MYFVIEMGHSVSIQQMLPVQPSQILIKISQNVH